MRKLLYYRDFGVVLDLKDLQWLNRKNAGLNMSQSKISSICLSNIHNIHLHKLDRT